MKRDLTQAEREIVKRLGVTDPDRAQRLLKDLTENTDIVEGRLVRVKSKG